MKKRNILILTLIIIGAGIISVHGAAPIATNDRYLIEQDKFINVPVSGVLTNDYDAENDPLTAVLSLTTSYGALILQSDGSFTYTPDAGFNGKDTFTYFANDGENSNEATVELIVGKWYILRQDDFEGGWGSMVSGGTDAFIHTGGPHVHQGTNTADIQDNSSDASSFFYGETIDASKYYQFKVGFWHKAVGLEYINTPPQVIGESYSMDQDTVLNIPAPGVLANDKDIDGEPITAVKVSGVSTVTLNSDGSFTYTPEWLFHGQVQFQYVANDGIDNSNPATTTITVNWVNSPPISVTNSYQVYRNHIYSNAAPGVLGNDYDYDPQTITAHTQTQCTNGTVTLYPDGSFSYDPDPDFMGTDSFEYYANDGMANGNIVTVYFYVVNKPPIATNDWYMVKTNTALSISASEGVLANDVDTDGHSITASIVSNPKQGTLALNADGSFDYTPTNAGFDGKDTFMYAANDGLTNGNVATVDIIIGRWITRTFDDFEDGYGNYRIPIHDEMYVERYTYVSNNNPTNFAHSGSNCMQIRRSEGENSMFLLKSPIDASSYFEIHVEYWFTSQHNTNTNANFLVRSFGGSAWEDITNHIATIDYVDNVFYSNKIILKRNGYIFPTSWNIGFESSMKNEEYVYIDDIKIRAFSTNTGPDAVDDFYVVMANSNTNVTIPGVIGNDIDSQMDAISVSIKSNPKFASSFTLYQDGSFEYAPIADFNGVDYFIYQGTDGQDTGNTAMVDITSGNWFILTYDNFETGWGNYSPGSNHTSLFSNTDGNYSPEGTVSAFMNFGNSLFEHKDPINIFVFEKMRVQFSYYSRAMEGPAEDLWVQLFDGTNWQTIRKLRLTVDFTNHGFHEADIVVDKDDFVFTTNAKVRFSANGSGVADRWYIDTITVSAFGGNSKPVANEDIYSNAMNALLSVPAPGVLDNDVDYNMDPITASWVSGPSHESSFNLNPDGSFTYRPVSFYTGWDSFSYKVNDGEADGNTTNVNIYIYWTNTPPYAIDDTNYSLLQDTKLEVFAPGFMANDSDYDGDPNLYAVLTRNVTRGILTFTSNDVAVSNGAFTYEPNAGYSGTDSFGYRLFDGQDLSTNEANVIITVQWVNTAPIAVDDSYSVMSSTTLYIAAPGVVGNDIDPDPQMLRAFTNTSVTQGTLTLETNGYFRYIPNPGYIGKDHFTYTVRDGVANGTTATVEITVNGYLELSCEDFESGWGSFTGAGNSSLLDNATYAHSPTYSVQLIGSSTTPGTFQYTSGIDISTYSELIIDYYCYPRALNSSSEGYFVEYFNGSGWEKVKSNYLGVGGLTNSTLSSNHIVLSRMDYTFPTNMNVRFTIDATGSGDYVYIDDVCIYGLTGMNNLPPIATNNSYIIGRDIVLDVGAPGLLGNDSDPDGDPLSAILVDPPAEGNVTINSDGSFSYRPKSHYFGSDNFTYKANDGIDDSNIATVDITIDEWMIITYDDFESGWSNYTSSGGNADVVTSANAHQGTDCAYVYGNADAFFYHTDGHDVKDYNKIKVNFWAWSEGMDSGQDTLDLEYFDGSKWVTIKALDPGTDFTNNQFSYVEVLIDRLYYGFPEDMKIRLRCDASTGGEGVYIDELKVSAAYINTPPVARDDKYEVNQKETLEVSATAPLTEYYYKEVDGILVNDLDYENDPLTPILVSNVTYGTLSLRSDGGFTYTPNSNFCGVDYFLYKANDGVDDSENAKVRIMVYPGYNDWVLLTYDNFESGWGNYTSGGSAVLHNGTNSFLGTYSAYIQDGGSGSYFVYDSSVDVTEFCKIKVELWFKSDGYSGTENFLIQYYDGGTWRNIADYDESIDFTDGVFSYKSVIISDSQYAFPSDMMIRIRGNGGSGDDLYVDEVRVSALPKMVGKGLVTLESWANVDNFGNIDFNFHDAYTYLPSVRADSNRYDIKNGNIIRGYLYPPESGSYSFRLYGKKFLEMRISSDDTRANLGVLIPETEATSNYPGEEASRTLTAGGKYYFEIWHISRGTTHEHIDLKWDIPNVGGTNYYLIEGDWISPVWILNTEPIAIGDSFTVDSDNTTIVHKSNSILNNDFDNEFMASGYRWFDGDEIEAVLIKDVGHGELVLNGNGSFIYTPDNGYTGSDFFRYSLYDGHHYSQPASVSITVAALNFSPVAVEDRYNVNNDDTLNITGIGVLENDIDKDGDSLTASLIGGGTSHGGLTLNSDGSFTYDPDDNFWGTDTFTYRANDSGPGTTTTVEIWVYEDTAATCGVLREKWNNFYANNIGAFTNLAAYPDSPNETTYLSQFSTRGMSSGDNYGERLRAFFIPKITGLYKFLDGVPSSDRFLLNIYRSVETRLYKVNLDTARRTEMYKGKKYLIEMLHTTAGGLNDRAEVTWRRIREAGAAVDQIIGCEYLVPIDANSSPVAEDLEFTVFENEKFEMPSSGVLHTATDGENEPLQAIPESDVASGTRVLSNSGALLYTPNPGFTGTDSFDYKVNDRYSDSDVKTITFNVIEGSNSNTKISNWATFDIGSPSPTLTSASKLLGFYAFANRSQDVIEVRGIRDEIHAKVTASNIQEVMPWADISGPNYGICSMAFTPSGRLLFIGVCASPDSPGMSPEGHKDAIIRYNVNLKKAYLFDTLTIAREMNGQENYGMSYYRGELFVGTEKGLRVYNAERNMKKGELIETHIPPGNPVVTGIDFDMWGEKIYVSTPDSLFRLEGFIPFYFVGNDNEYIRYYDRPDRELEFMAAGSNFADVTFGRSYGSFDTDGLYVLQKNSSDSKLYWVPTYDAREPGEAGLVAYTKINGSVNGISATACGRMLLAASVPQIMSDNRDTRFKFEDFTVYHLTNIVNEKKAGLVSDKPYFDSKGAIGGQLFIYCYAYHLMNDPEAEDIVEQTVRLYRGDTPDAVPERSLDGLFGGMMGSRFPWTSFPCVRDTFEGKNSYVYNEVKDLINGTFYRLRDYLPMPGRSDEANVSGFGHTWNPKYNSELEGEGGWMTWFGAGQDPLERRDWMDSMRYPWTVRNKPWVLWGGYADQFELSQDVFELYSRGGRWEQALDDGEEYVNRADGNMYNWFFYFMGNKHFCTDPYWKQIFRNIIAAYQGLTDDRPTPYLSVYNHGDFPNYEHVVLDDFQNIWTDVGDPLQPIFEVIDLEAITDLCTAGEIFPEVGLYLAYREGRMIKMGAFQEQYGYNYEDYDNVWIFGRFCRLAPYWSGSSGDTVNVGIAEAVKPGSLVEMGYLNDVFKIDIEISTNVNNNVVLGFSEMTPRRVLVSDDGINWLSYGLQYSPYELDNGKKYEYYRVEDPEGQHLTMVMGNVWFEDGWNDWSRSGDCLFEFVDGASGINISGTSAEVRATPSSTASDSSMRIAIDLSKDYTNTQYIVRGNGFVSSDGSPGEGYMRLVWDTDSNPGNGTIGSTLKESVRMSSNNRFVEFRIDTVKPATANYLHVYFILDPVQILAVNKRYIFDNLSIVRLGVPVVLNNPDFESGDISSWVGVDNGQMLSITTEPKEVMEGSYSLKITTDPKDYGLMTAITNSFFISNDLVATRYIIRAKVKAKKQRATTVSLDAVLIPNAGVTRLVAPRIGIQVEPYFDGDYVFSVRNTGTALENVGLNSHILLVIRVTRKVGSVDDVDEIILDDIRITKERAWPHATPLRPWIIGH